MSATEERYPDDLRYHAEHDWARIGDAVAELGITWFAQDAIGELVFVDLPAVGTSLTKDAAYAEVESVKAVSDVIAPLSGSVVEVNDHVVADPALVNADPYGHGWLVRVLIDEPSEQRSLLSAAEYRELLANG